MAEKKFSAYYDGNNDKKISLELHVYTVATSIANNTTTERADLYAVVHDASYGWYNGYGTEAFVGINGHNTTKTVNFDYRTTGEKALISTWDTVVKHDNNGKASIEVSAHHYSGVGLGNANISGTYTCDTVPRYATSNQSLNSKTETTIKMNWSSDNIVDYIWYSKDNGSTWTGINVTDGKSGTYTITGLSEYTKYNIKTRVRRKDSQLTTDSTTLAVTTYPYPYCTSTPNFTIGNKLTLNFYNPLNRKINITGIGADGSVIFTGSTNGTTLTGFNDNESVQKQYKSIPDSENGKYKVQVKYGVVTKTRNNNNTYSIKGTEKPIFTNFTYNDTDTVTKILTGGNNQILVNKLSDVNVTVSLQNKATSNYSANIVKYIFAIGNTSKEIQYSDTKDVSTSFVNITSGNISVTAVDSRGLKTTVSKNSIFKNWSEPIFSEINVNRENGIGNNVLFDLLVKYWNDNFGSVNNKMVKFSYRYKKVNEDTYSNYIDITDRMLEHGENFQNIDAAYLPAYDKSITPAMFEVGYEYNIQFACVDESKKIVYSDVIILNSGIPCTSKLKKSDGTYSVGINKLPDENYAFDINGNLNASGVIHIDKRPQLIRNVENIEKLKTIKIVENEVIQTLGFYKENDGGTAIYKIVSQATADGCFVHELNNGLYAKLIVENNEVNIRQLGARSQEITDKRSDLTVEEWAEKYDIKKYIEAYIDELARVDNRFKLYIPAGIWYTSPTIIENDCKGFDIYGDTNFGASQASGTVITSIYNTQSYLWQIGNENYYTRNFNLANITFSSADFQWSDTYKNFWYKTVKTITDQGLRMIHAIFGFTDNLMFSNIKGKALSMCSCWEVYFGLLNFRNISCHDKSVFVFETVNKNKTSDANLSALTFEKIMAEGIHGDLIECQDDCRLVNCHFGVINFEGRAFETDDVTYTSFTPENVVTFNDETAIHSAIFVASENGNPRGIVINSIEINNLGYRYYNYNGKNYVQDTIFKVSGNGVKHNIIIDNISITGMMKAGKVALNKGFDSAYTNELIVSNISLYANPTSPQKYLRLDVDGLWQIKCPSLYKEGGSEAHGVPFYKVVNQTSKSERTKGLLFYDEDSKNDLKLVVIPEVTTPDLFFCATLTVTGNIMNIQAKVPSGQQALLALSRIKPSAINVTKTLVGTGAYKMYTIDTSNFEIGDTINLRLSINNTATECRLDFYEFTNGENYSVGREQKIGMRNGKPWYRIEIESTMPTVATAGTAVWKQVYTIPNADFGRIVSSTGKLNNTGYFSCLERVSGNSLSQYARTYFDKIDGKDYATIQIISSITSYNGKPVWIVAEYTKSTD